MDANAICRSPQELRLLDLPNAIGTLRHSAAWADKIEGRTIPTPGYMGTPTLSYTQQVPTGVVGPSPTGTLCCELAMVCDVLIAAKNAKFGRPEINLEIIPGAGGTQQLIRAVGKSFAMQMVLTGAWIDAGTAERKGLVSEVTEAKQALPRALEIAGDIAAKPPLAVTAAKRALNNAFETHLGVGLELEQQSLALLSGTDDRKAGIDAFMNKCQPTFKGS